jgi:hypothetical protein
MSDRTKLALVTAGVVLAAISWYAGLIWQYGGM